MNSELRIDRDKKGRGFILSHKRCGFTECVWLDEDEMLELGMLVRKALGYLDF